MSTLRVGLLALIILFIFGCASNKGLDAEGQAYNLAFLNAPHHYPTPTIKPTYIGWWKRFNDPLLNQLIAVALSDSPDMQMARSRVQEAKQLANQAGSALWPSIDASGYIQRQRFSEFGLVPPPFNGETFNIGDVGLNLNYDFDFWGKNRENLASALSETAASQANAAAARLILSAAITSLYFQTQNLVAQCQLIKSQAMQRQAMLTIITARAAHGIASDIPVKTALAEWQAANIATQSCQQIEAQNRNELIALMGKNPFATDINIPPYVSHAYQTAMPTLLPAHLLANRPDIATAYLRANAAAHRVNIAKARFFPDINLSLLFSYQSIRFNELFNPASQNNAITGAIDLPIFDAGERRAFLGMRYAEYDAAVEAYNKTILTALHEVADQLVSLNALKIQLKAEQQALAATQHNYQLTISRYHHGIVDYLAVLESKDSLLEQQRAQLDLKNKQVQATIAMLKALGGVDCT